MAKLSRDQVNPPGGTALLHPRETLFITGVLGAVGNEIVLPSDGAASLALDLRGTFSLTVEIAGTVDGINWTLIPVRPINQASVQYVSAVAGTAAGVWAGKCAPFRSIRARVTAYTSGSVIASIATDIAPLDDSLQGQIAPLIVTNTGVAAAAVTLTLPAPGAGLRQYITFLGVTRSATALLTAGAAPTIVTTTNLPGSLAFTFGADAAMQGTDKIFRENFTFAVASTAPNTATTIIAPATTGVIWRINVAYYVAP